MVEDFSHMSTHRIHISRNGLTHMHNKSTVIYIEDNADNQRLVQRILEPHGYGVSPAKGGPGGIARARESRPKLILVDINIPGLDGYETTTRLRGMEHLRSVPIVALTADIRVGARERSLVAGCDGYITKPIDPRSLPEQLSEFIGGKREALPPDAQAPPPPPYNPKLVYPPHPPAPPPTPPTPPPPTP